MQAIDRLAIEEYGVSGLTLMENAGRGIVAELKKRFNNLSNKRVIVFCGKGNNGGDGFVIARHLFNLGTEVITFLIGRRVDLKDDTAVNAESAINLGIAVQEVNTNNLSSLDPAIANCDLIVDTLFGTGLTRPATGLYEQTIEKLCRCWR